MNNLINLPKRHINDMYPSALSYETPKTYELISIDYKQEEINQYFVGIWHRFLKKYYGQPNEIECFLCEADNSVPISDNKQFQLKKPVTFRYTEESKITFLNINNEYLEQFKKGNITLSPGFINWKYFIKLPSNNIIIIGTKEFHSKLLISIIKQKTSSDERRIFKETRKFISYILEEIRKQQNNLINPKKLLKNRKSIYTLWNVYLSNYSSGNHLIKVAPKTENELRKKLHEHDEKTVLSNIDAMEHTQAYSLICGTYYTSAISFFFMAFEGFINILFHAFVKNEFNDLDMERSLNLEQKIRFMPSLCTGFKCNSLDITSTVYKKFKELKAYRNKLFHSKVEDSIKSVMIMDDLFFYNYPIDEYKPKKSFLPPIKAHIEIEDVIQVKEIVDNMINTIIEGMEQKAIKFVETYIFKESHIPFTGFDKINPIFEGNNTDTQD